MEEVHHCHSHCHLAENRVLEYERKYGASMWLATKKPCPWKLRLSAYKNVSFLANHGAVFPLIKSDQGIPPNDSVTDSGWPLYSNPYSPNPELRSQIPDHQALYPIPYTLYPKP